MVFCIRHVKKQLKLKRSLLYHNSVVIWFDYSRRRLMGSLWEREKLITITDDGDNKNQMNQNIPKV
jgi:hypothetical protein